MAKQWWGIWCKDSKDGTGAWLDSPDGRAVYAYPTKAKACKIAAELYGMNSYREARSKGWCEVRPLSK